MDYHNTTFYVDAQANIKELSTLRIINLNDYSEEAQGAFLSLQQGDVGGFFDWSLKYGRKEGKSKGQVLLARGWTSIISEETDQFVNDVVGSTGLDKMPFREVEYGENGLI